MVKKDSLYFFESFVAFPEVVHAFSTKAIGDMRPSHAQSSASRLTLAQKLNINPAKLVGMHQIHSSQVEQIDLYDSGKVIPNADGLVTATRNVFLSVMSADCVPILLFDRYKKSVGVVHAGWRGLYSEIIPIAVEQMKDLGANPIDIIAGIGPCIRSCHYTIDEKRKTLFANKFLKKHGNTVSYIVNLDDKTYLNMPVLARLQLMNVGILEEHIEDSGLCTFDEPDLYSYRRDGEDFGEFLGIIGRK